MPIPLPVAAVAAALVAGAAWRIRTLTGPGAGAAVMVGTAIVGGLGVAGAAVLLAFFVGASLVGRLVRGPSDTGGGTKGETRDGRQVLANGGAAAVAALPALAGSTDPRWSWVAAAALAAAAADTWATAWGRRSRAAPRLVTTWQPVPPGTNGGITAQGTVGAAAGALTVAVAGAAAGLPAGWIPALAALGVAGMLADALAGAALQVRRDCRRCGAPTEAPRHCGEPTRRTGGIAGFDNDGVNLLSTTATAALAAAVGPLPR